MVVQVGFQAYSCISRINVPDKPKSAADLRNKRLTLSADCSAEGWSDGLEGGAKGSAGWALDVSSLGELKLSVGC